MTGHLIKSLNILNPHYTPWITCAFLKVLEILRETLAHGPLRCLGTAMWAFQCVCRYGSGSMTHDKPFPMPYQLIPSVSLNEAWGKSDSLSFSGNDRFAKRGPGKCLPHAAQLGLMHSSLWPSLPFPSIFKISIATFLLIVKTRRLSSVLHLLYVKWMCWARKINCLNERIHYTSNHAGIALLKPHALIPCYTHQLCKKLQEDESPSQTICGCYS